MKLKESLYTASNMRNDPRWKHGDLTRISTLCNQRGVKGNFIECAIRGLQINSSNARRHFDTVRAIANEYLAAREAGSPIEVLTPREELKQLRSTATPAVVQNPTTAPGTGHTVNLLKLAENNSALADENAHLRTRNAALEENATYMENRLEERQDELVALGKELDQLQSKCASLEGWGLKWKSDYDNLRTKVQELEADVTRADFQYGGLHNENKELKEEVDELQKQNETTARKLATAYKDYDHLQGVNDRNAERMYEAEAKADELEEDNTRLRTALLEQATCFATTLKALLPQA